MRRIFLSIFALWLCGQIIIARADTFPLADGTSVGGDIVSFDDFGIKFRSADGTYSDRIPWAKFSQEGLKQLSDNPKIKPLVEPFVEIPLSERPKKHEVKVQEVSRLVRPAPQSFFGALFSSSVGLFALVLIYAGNVYSGYEIAVFRARPKALVMGVAAVLPIIGPIIFLCMPMQAQTVSVEEQAAAEAVAAAEAATFNVPGQPAAEDGVQVTAESMAAQPNKPAGQVFQRGQFTFNRRFIETKFAGFFGAVRHGAEKDQVLIVKAGTGQFIAERITRISSADMHLEVVQDGAHQEIMVPFAQILEMQIQPKTA
ncbi:MAG: hypothetical protein WDM80_03915 [Limisphaerales bacterium]